MEEYFNKMPNGKYEVEVSDAETCMRMKRISLAQIKFGCNIDLEDMINNKITLCVEGSDLLIGYMHKPKNAKKVTIKSL